MRKVRWGVISTAKIAQTQLIPAIQQAENAELVAIASRDEAKGQRLADELGLSKAYGSYEALLADPDIDAIYNPLPNHLHVPISLAAAKVGKHVLCEKPIALSAEDAEQLRQKPDGVMIMEAFMVRFHPQWQRVRELVKAGELGEVKAAQGFFSYFNRDPANVRQKPEWGGGGLLDIGVYPLVTGRYVFDAEPKRVIALVERDPEFGVDRLASALVDFGDGRQLTFTVSMQLSLHQRMFFYGTKKRLEVTVPFNPEHHKAAEIRINDGSSLGEDGSDIITVEATNQYQRQVEAFSQAISCGEPLPYGVEDAILSMRILDALFRSEVSGHWEDV